MIGRLVKCPKCQVTGEIDAIDRDPAQTAIAPADPNGDSGVGIPIRPECLEVRQSSVARVARVIDAAAAVLRWVASGNSYKAESLRRCDLASRRGEFLNGGRHAR